MTSKETTQRCRGCTKAISDMGQMMCMGVQPIAFIDDISDDDCPRHRVTTETSGIKKSKRRGVKAVAKEITAPVVVTEQAEWAQKTEPVSAAQPVAEAVKTGGDRIHNPDHYNWKGEECIYLIRILCRGEEGLEGYCKGNILKYLYREKKKNGLEDLKKARVYLDMLINYREGKEAAAKSKRG